VGTILWLSACARDAADVPRAVAVAAPDPVVLFEDGVVHDVHISLDEDALAALEDEPREDVHATFRLGDEPVPHLVGLHLKGQYSFRPLDEKPAFKIDFHEWEPAGRLHGVKRLALNNMVQDETMLHEHVYYWLCGQVGLRAPRHGYAHVWVNDEDYGLYGIVEALDEQFLARGWPLDAGGNLYEGAGNDFTDERGDDFELQEEGVGETIAELVARVEATPEEQWLAMLEASFDVDALLTYFAVELFAGNPDGYPVNRNNFFVYHAPIAGRWALVPWGTDRSFGDPDVGARGPVDGVLAERCLRDEACATRLEDHLRDVVDVWEASDGAGRVSEWMALVGPLCEADPRREKNCNLEHILEFLAERRELD
jgi:spore coat protein CotH